jgi:hypothetical protein
LEPDLAASYSFGSQHYPQLSVDCLNHWSLYYTTSSILYMLAIS